MIIAGDERIVGRVDEARLVKREESDGEEPDGTDRSSRTRITYETQWLSDEEGDAEELTELLNDRVSFTLFGVFH